MCFGEPVRSKVSFPGFGEVADAMLGHSLDPVADTTGVDNTQAIKTSRLHSSCPNVPKKIKAFFDYVGTLDQNTMEPEWLSQ